ncbi:MAG TPA: ParB-like protein [Candidatus Bathyarchaeia archaeon]|nr:ParB-like protein [Candidatus Bathyarchaeia archaeon]
MSQVSIGEGSRLVRRAGGVVSRAGIVLARGGGVLLTALLVASPSHAKHDELPRCSLQSANGTRCTVAVKDLRPTQFAVGMREVREKAERIARMTKAERTKFLSRKPEPIVIAPGGLLYITDHHHLARALLDQDVKDTYAVVEDNLAGDADFWGTMKSRHWVDLCGADGKGPHSPEELPTSVAGLADDPYRSLAGAVDDAGGFRKSDAPFVEFRWANFLRTRVPIGASFQQAVKAGIEVAHSKDACGLPGYAGAATECPTKDDPGTCL